MALQGPDKGLMCLVGCGANHYDSNLLEYVTTMFTCLIWTHSIYRNPHFLLRSTLNCLSWFNHHMKIFSETSVDFKISMACYSHGLFGHCRLFIILSRQIFPSDTRLCKCFTKAFQEPPVPYNAAPILVTPYVGKLSHMVIRPCWLALIQLRAPY